MISQRKQTDDDSRKIQRDVLVMLVYGVGIWGLATSAIMAAGPLLLPKTGSRAGIAVIVLLALGALVVSRLAYGLYRHGREDALVDRLLFSTVVAISGLLLDALIYAFAIGRYPVLSSNQQGSVAFFLVASYGALLLAPHIPPHSPRKRSLAADAADGGVSAL